jgi:hypothetical protein
MLSLRIQNLASLWDVVLLEQLIDIQVFVIFPIAIEPQGAALQPLNPLPRHFNSVYIPIPFSPKFSLILSSHTDLGYTHGYFQEVSEPEIYPSPYFNMYIYNMYIYRYMCVCVCVCV